MPATVSTHQERIEEIRKVAAKDLNGGVCFGGVEGRADVRFLLQQLDTVRVAFHQACIRAGLVQGTLLSIGCLEVENERFRRLLQFDRSCDHEHECASCDMAIAQIHKAVCPKCLKSARVYAEGLEEDLARKHPEFARLKEMLQREQFQVKAWRQLRQARYEEAEAEVDKLRAALRHVQFDDTVSCRGAGTGTGCGECRACRVGKMLEETDG